MDYLLLTDYSGEARTARTPYIYFLNSYIYFLPLQCMETVQRKLIDLRAPVVRAISIKARAKSLSFKRYVEQLIEEDAAKDNSLSLIPEEVTDPVLLGMVGIAAGNTDTGKPDDRLDYILSKLHDR